MSSRAICAIVAIVCATIVTPDIHAQSGYERFTDWEGWSRLNLHESVGLAGSFQRAGGNDDFSSYDDPAGVTYIDTAATVRELQGPGVIRRFWMPHLTAKQQFAIRLYIDGETLPRVDTDSLSLLRGDYGYFDAPFVDTFAGGQVSYEPIPFAESVRIESVNKAIPTDRWSRDRHYYQYAYSLFPPGTPITSYTGTLDATAMAARSASAAVLQNVGQHPAGIDPTATEITTTLTTIPAGGVLAMADLTGPGIVRRFTICAPAATDEQLADLRLRVYYDGNSTPAIDVSVAAFFGAGNDRVPYQSLPLGTLASNGFYSFWPMPFRESALIELYNSGATSVDIDETLVEVAYRALSFDHCYLHAMENASVRQPGVTYYNIVTATGRGHYVGNLLYVEQDSYSFYMLEGDERITIDGQPAVLGTGLEDAYNGGYYYNWVGSQGDEPEGRSPQSATRPLNGLLYIHREEGVAHGRADQYRWYIPDPVPFDESIQVDIESVYGIAGSNWHSVGFWYQQPLRPDDIDGDGTENLTDNCPALFNPDQADRNDDGFGDVCSGACVGSDGSCVEVPSGSCAAFVCDVSPLLPATFAGCIGDVDGSGVVNASDRGFVSANIGIYDVLAVCIFDLDGSGIINASDRGIVSANIGLCEPLPDFQNGSGLHGGAPDSRFPGVSYLGDNTQCSGM